MKVQSTIKSFYKYFSPELQKYGMIEKINEDVNKFEEFKKIIARSQYKNSEAIFKKLQQLMSLGDNLVRELKESDSRQLTFAFPN